MKKVPNRRVRAIGEAMVELAPVGDGLYRKGFAGDTFNTAWHMARWLGQDAEVGMITRLGTDSLSQSFAQEMSADGLVLDGVSHDPLRRMGLYLIELDGVERSFHYWRDTSAARGLADEPDRLTQALAGTGLVHLSGITLAILTPSAREILFAALGQLRAAGGLVSFDPNIRPRLWSSAQEIRDTITRMLALTDIALPSLDDEGAHFGDHGAAVTISRMAGHGVAEVVVKDGPGPVTLGLDGAMAVVPTPCVTDIRDTTGAGDAFNAGYLAARVMGQTPEAAVTAGQKLAALVLRQFGARADKTDISTLPRPRRQNG